MQPTALWSMATASGRAVAAVHTKTARLRATPRRVMGAPVEGYVHSQGRRCVPVDAGSSRIQGERTRHYTREGSRCWMETSKLPCSRSETGRSGAPSLWPDECDQDSLTRSVG